MPITPGSTSSAITPGTGSARTTPGIPTPESGPRGLSHVEYDLEVRRRVRERVGDDVTLTYDPWETYGSYEEALKVGHELEALGIARYGHPFSEYQLTSSPP